MTEDKEPILGVLDNPIFPIADRNTPIADRIRNRRSGDSDIGAQVGELVGKMAVVAEDEERVETGDELMEQFRKGIANTLGVPEQQINQELVSEFGAMFIALDEDDIVVEPSEDEENSEEEEESEEIDSKDSSSPF